jgi:oxygen-independent coproporphyrinogen-3 oxidase
VSAISHVGDSYSQNPRELPGWEIAVDRGQPPVWRGIELSFDDRIRADVIQQLMCHGFIDVAAIERRHEVVFGEYFADALRKLAALRADGLVEPQGPNIVATSRGRLLLRIIAMCFDNYLAATAATARPRYSRVV